jgi:hypothetical protein
MSTEITAEEVDFVSIDKHLINQAIDVLDALKKRGLKAVTAESCTGGLISTVLSEAPGLPSISREPLSSTRRNRNTLPSRSPPQLSKNRAL